MKHQIEVSTTVDLIRGHCTESIYEDVTPELMDKLEDIGNRLKSRGFYVEYMYAPVALATGSITVTAMSMTIDEGVDPVDRIAKFVMDRPSPVKTIVLYKYYEYPQINQDNFKTWIERKVRFGLVS